MNSSVHSSKILYESDCSSQIFFMCAYFSLTLAPLCITKLHYFLCKPFCSMQAKLTQCKQVSGHQLTLQTNALPQTPARMLHSLLQAAVGLFYYLPISPVGVDSKEPMKKIHNHVKICVTGFFPGNTLMSLNILM